jgi:hypothetical protein
MCFQAGLYRAGDCSNAQLVDLLYSKACNRRVHDIAVALREKIRIIRVAFTDLNGILIGHQRSEHSRPLGQQRLAASGGQCQIHPGRR